MNRARTFAMISLLLLSLDSLARAQWASQGAGASPQGDPGLLNEVGFEQKLDRQMPLGLTFTDEAGAQVRLSKYFGEKPVVLALVYYECPMLCTLTLNGLLRAMRALSFDAGNTYQVITVSFDPTEKPALAASKKKAYLSQYGRAGAEAGWHFLTGDRQTIQALTSAVGFNYRYDAKTKQFAHPTGLVVLTPAGRISRYFFGVEFSAKDLKLALLEASSGRIGTLTDRVFLYCYRYDPVHGKYGFAILNAVRALGVVTVLGLAGLFLWATRRERMLAYRPPAAPSS